MIKRMEGSIVKKTRGRIEAEINEAIINTLTGERIIVFTLDAPPYIEG